jgi:hypothetical protein
LIDSKEYYESRYNRITGEDEEDIANQQEAMQAIIDDIQQQIDKA